MTNNEMLTRLIASANQNYLDEFEVTLTAKDLTFSKPAVGDYGNGNNTAVRVTANTQFVYGSYVYHYKRLDMQQAFIDLGVPNPSVQVNDIIGAGVLNALKAKYNFILHASEVADFIIEGNVCTITVEETSLVWTGKLIVYLAEVELVELSVAFPNNVLNGLD